jgi:hypothetical protein
MPHLRWSVRLLKITMVTATSRFTPALLLSGPNLRPLAFYAAAIRLRAATAMRDSLAF